MSNNHTKKRVSASPGHPFLVSVLMNSIFYFIESAFIIAVEGGYRLLVIHQGVLLTDEYYRTIKGARIAFRKLWGYKAWKENVQSEWSHFYPPDGEWVREKMPEAVSSPKRSVLGAENANRLPTVKP